MAASSSSYIPQGDHRAIERAVLGAGASRGQIRDPTTGLSLSFLREVLEQAHLRHWLGQYQGEMTDNVHLAELDGASSPFLASQRWRLRLGSTVSNPRALGDDERALKYATVDLYAGFGRDEKCLYRFKLSRLSLHQKVQGFGLNLKERGYHGPRLERFGNMAFEMELKPKDPELLKNFELMGTVPNAQDDIHLVFYLHKGVTGHDPHNGLDQAMAERGRQPPASQVHLERLHEYVLQNIEDPSRNELRQKVQFLEELSRDDSFSPKSPGHDGAFQFGIGGI